MQFDEFIAKLARRSDIDDPTEISNIVLEELGRRLAGQEPGNLAAQLPAELKSALTRHTGAAETFDVDDFYRRIAEREGAGIGTKQARAHAEAVLGTIASFVSEGELDDVQAQLPEGYRQLLR